MPEIFNLKNLNYWLMEFLLPHLEAHSWAYEINHHLWERPKCSASVKDLKLKLNSFFSKYLFCILTSLSQNPISN